VSEGSQTTTVKEEGLSPEKRPPKKHKIVKKRPKARGILEETPPTHHHRVGGADFPQHRQEMLSRDHLYVRRKRYEGSLVP
jgi:hypothetical protein